MSETWGRVRAAFEYMRAWNWKALTVAAAFVAAAWTLPLLAPKTHPPLPQATQHTHRPANHRENTKSSQWVSDIPSAIVGYIGTKYGEPYSEYCTRDPSKKNEEWLHKFACDVRITDVVVAAFTIVLALFTIVLAIVGIWQAVITRRAFRRQLRAYIFVTETKRLAGHQADLPRTMSVKNTGQTPAYDVRVALFGNIGPAENATFEPIKFDKDTHRIAIGPGESITLTAKSDPPLTPEQLAEIQAGTRAFYMYGRVSYRDAFRKRRHSNFRRVYTKDSIQGGGFSFCNDGNDAN